MPKGKAVKICYWRHAIGEDALITEHKSKLDELITGSHVPADLEKLKNYNIYSYRVNERDRLLFTTIEMHGESYLLVLDIVLSHDYHKNRFLKNKMVLKKFLETNGEQLTDAVMQYEFSRAINPIKITEKDKAYTECKGDDEIVSVDYFNGQFIQLSDEQENVLSVKLPALISGSAGSGKSCVAMSLLAAEYHKCFLETSESIQEPMLYVSESSRLVRAMQQMWMELYPDNSELTVQFKTYNELLFESPALIGKTLVDKLDFETWYSDYFKRNHKAQKVKGTATINIEKETAYQEFRIRSGYSAEDYYKLGERQSLLKSIEEKVWIEDAYQRYLNHLSENNLINPDFSLLQLQQKYSLVIADEALDFSCSQLRKLFGLALNKRFVCCADSNQSLRDQQSKLHFLLSLLRGDSVEEATHIQLSSTYRCPSNILDAANIVLDMKNVLTGGLSDSYERRVIKGKSSDDLIGEVHVIANMTDDPTLLEAAQTTDFAVITLPEFVEEARTIFGTNLVFTPEEIKGLEYKTVVLYKLLESPVFKEAGKQMMVLDKQGASHEVHHRPGPDAKEENAKFRTYFNQLFVAITRTKVKLVIFERFSRCSDSLLKQLRAIKNNATLLTVNASQSSTDADWEAEASKLMEIGLVRQARDIFLLRLNRSEEDFMRFTSQQHLKLSRNEPIASLVPVAEPAKKMAPATSLKKNPKLPATATPKTDGQVSEEKNSEVTLLENLITFFTMKNLELLMKNDEKTIKKLLFDSRVTSGDFKGSLFEYILASEEKTYYLAELLDKNKKLVKVIRLQKSAIPRNSVLSNHAAIIVAARCLFVQDNGTVAKNTLKDFIDKASSIELPVILSILANDNKQGPLILQWILEKGSKSIQKKKIPCQTLFCTKPSKEKHFSLLYWLVSTAPGVKIITTGTFDLKELTGKDLIVPLTAAAGPAENCTPLYWLTATPEGREILQKNPHLLKELTGKNLCLARTAAAGKVKNTTPLSFLASSPEGIQILRENPHLLEGITGKELILARIADAGKFENTTPLYWLVGSPEGIQILQENPHLLEGITGKDLILARTSTAGPDENCTPLYWLTAIPEGREILRENPHLLEGLTGKDLILARTAAAGPDENTTPLYWLTATPEGRKILQKNPHLLKGITGKDLILPRNAAAEKYEKTTPLFFLCANAEGREILINLAIDSNFLSEIPLDAWQLEVTYNDPITSTPLSNLLASGDSFNALLERLNLLSPATETKEAELKNSRGDSPLLMHGLFAPLEESEKSAPEDDPNTLYSQHN